MTTPVWEVCAGCGQEFMYPHLCREHRLCGFCHPPVDYLYGDSEDEVLPR